MCQAQRRHDRTVGGRERLRRRADAERARAVGEQPGAWVQVDDQGLGGAEHPLVAAGGVRRRALLGGGDDVPLRLLQAVLREHAGDLPAQARHAQRLALELEGAIAHRRAGEQLGDPLQGSHGAGRRPPHLSSRRFVLALAQPPQQLVAGDEAPPQLSRTRTAASTSPAAAWPPRAMRQGSMPESSSA